MPSLSEKTVVITGASSGIGRAAAIEMARRGAHVVLAARRVEALEQTAAECRLLGVRATVIATDVRDRAQCRALIDMTGRVDVLVNNAGFAVFDAIPDADEEQVRAMMETNYLGTFHCTQAVLPQMLERRDGAIVNVGSIAGIMGYARMSAYCASKFATIGFSESLRAEVAGRGVRVALVCPGTTETGFFDSADRMKMPGASRLIGAVQPERVARAICNAAVDGAYRRIIPFPAALYMRMKELFPRTAHLVMRRVSSLMERG